MPRSTKPRHKGGKAGKPVKYATFADLPVELVHMIAEACEEGRIRDDHSKGDLHDIDSASGTLSRLCQTCKALDNLCSIALYRTVIIRDHIVQREISPTQSLLRLLQALQRRPHLGACMRVLHLPSGPVHTRDLPEDLRAEVAQVIQADRFARKAASASPEDQCAILVFLTLQLVPQLTSLKGPSLGFIAAHWPKGRRLVGTALSRLEVFPAADLGWWNNSNRGHETESQGLPHSLADRVFQWPLAFQPGLAPAALQWLAIEDWNPQPFTIEASWYSITASVRHLKLSLPCFCPEIFGEISRLLVSCPLVTHVDLSDSEIGSRTLSHLPHEFPGQDLVAPNVGIGNESRNLTQTSHPMHLLKHLTHLNVPLRDCIHDKSLAIWPPALEELALSVDDSGPDPRALTLYTNAIRSELMPKALTSIVIYEWDAAAGYGFFDTVSDLLKAADDLISLEEACKAKRITLLHQQARRPGEHVGRRHGDLKEAMRIIFGQWCDASQSEVDKVVDMEVRERMYALTDRWYWRSTDLALGWPEVGGEEDYDLSEGDEGFEMDDDRLEDETGWWGKSFY